MKRLIFVLALLLPAFMSQALTVNGLFKKYKKFPEAQYVKMNEKELRAQMDSITSEEEKEILKTAKGMEMLLVNLQDDEIEKMNADLNSLKNYCLALSFTHNNGKQSLNIVEDGVISKESIKESMNEFIESFLNPTITVDVYGKDVSDDNSDDIISKPLYLFTIWGMRGLIFIDGNIKVSEADNIMNFIKTDTDTTVNVKVETVPSDKSESSDQTEPSE